MWIWKFLCLCHCWEQCWRQYVMDSSCIHPEILWMQYLINCLREFDHICNNFAPGVKDEVIGFYGQKVKRSGSQAEQIWSKSTFGGISRHRTLNEDSLNWFECAISDCAILGKMRSKVKGQGHHQSNVIKAEASMTAPHWGGLSV